jgi:hypothetical protein
LDTLRVSLIPLSVDRYEKTKSPIMQQYTILLLASIVDTYCIL